MDKLSNDDTIFQEFGQLEDEQKNQLLLQMKLFIQQLQSQITDLEKSAIAIIIDKDEQILYLESKCRDRKSLNKDEEIVSLKNHIQELNQRIEIIQQKHHESLQEYEQKWNQYLLDQIQQTSEDGYNQQKGLLDSLRHLEEKQQKLDRDLEMKEVNEINLKNELALFQQQSYQLQNQVDDFEKTILKTQRELELKKTQHQKELLELNSKINKLQNQIVSLQRQNQNLKLHMQKVSQQNKEYLSTISELIQNKEELEQLLTQQESSVIYKNYDLLFLNDHSTYQKTAQSTDQGNKEELNRSQILFYNDTTAFDLCGEEEHNNLNSNPDNSLVYISKLDEKDQIIQQYEQYIEQNTQIMKEQKASLELVNQQLAILRKNQFNQKKLREYVQELENSFLVSKTLMAEKQDQYLNQIAALRDENKKLKLTVKASAQKFIKKCKQYQTAILQ